MLRNPGKLVSLLVLAILFVSVAALPASTPAMAGGSAGEVKKTPPPAPSPDMALARKVEGLMKYLSLDRTTIFKILVDSAQKVPPVVAAAGRLTAARMAILDEILKPEMDAAVVKKHAASVISSFDELSRGTHDLVLGLKSHLSPEQQEKMIMGILYKGFTSIRKRRGGARMKGPNLAKKVRKQMKGFVKRLGLSPEQRVAMKADLLAAMPGLIESGTKVLSQMIGCGAEMLKPDCSRDAAEKRRAEVVAAVREMSDRGIDLVLKVRSRLHPEQMDRLRKVFPLRLMAGGM